MNVVFDIPGPRDPGYLKRTMRMAEFNESLDGKGQVEQLNLTIDLLAEFVSEPKGKAKAREAVMDISQEEFESVMKRIQGGQADPNSSGPSGAGGGGG